MAMRPVIVCANNAIVFGYSKCTTKATITLERARWAYYYVNVGSHLGLATDGPQEGSRIGGTGTITLRGNIVCVIECTPEAAEKWNSFPVSIK